MKRLLILIFLFFPWGVAIGHSESHFNESKYFSLELYNDRFASSKDRHFTSKFLIEYISRKERSQKNLRFGQEIYTPQNIKTFDLVTGDRPYAGWLHFGVGKRIFKGGGYDEVFFDVGMVGPLALGKEFQKAMHWVTFSPPINGWSNQLKNEPGFILSLSRNRTLFHNKDWNIKPFINISVQVGNIRTDGSVGFGLKTTELDNLELQIGVMGRYKIRDIFLDGNSWKKSHSVSKKDFVYDIYIGGEYFFLPCPLSDDLAQFAL